LDSRRPWAPCRAAVARLPLGARPTWIRLRPKPLHSRAQASGLASLRSRLTPAPPAPVRPDPGWSPANGSGDGGWAPPPAAGTDAGAPSRLGSSPRPARLPPTSLAVLGDRVRSVHYLAIDCPAQLKVCGILAVNRPLPEFLLHPADRLPLALPAYRPIVRPAHVPTHSIGPYRILLSPPIRPSIPGTTGTTASACTCCSATPPGGAVSPDGDVLGPAACR
jgi:hypothetical protein